MGECARFESGVGMQRCGGKLRLLVILGSFACVGSVSAQSPGADAFPTRPVRMLIPFAPGGGSDIIGRLLAHALTERWGHTVVVDNRPGAGSTVGTAIAAKAPGDGHNLLVSSSAIAFSPALYRNLPFDVTRDFAAVSLLARQPSMLAVAASVPANSVPELIALARARPGKLTFGSAGVGSATHLGGELFKSASGIDLLHVPYKSAGQAMNAPLSGEVQVQVTNMATVLPHAKAGRTKTLGITSAARSSLAPEVPTVAESGLKGFAYDTWYALLVPVATPVALVGRIHADTVAVLGDRKLRAQLNGQGVEVVASTPVELSAYLRREIDTWAGVVRTAGLAGQ